MGGLDDLLAHTASSHGTAVDGMLASSVPAGTNDTAVSTASIGGTVSRRVSGMSGRLGHAAAWTVGSITRSTTPGGTIVLAPAGLASEGSVVEAVECGRAGTVDERCNANKRDVVDCFLH